MNRIVFSILICFLSVNSFPSLCANNYSTFNSCKYENYQSSYWNLEYHDDTWWWVQYDEDGTKIMEIPAEF